MAVTQSIAREYFTMLKSHMQADHLVGTALVGLLVANDMLAIMVRSSSNNRSIDDSQQYRKLESNATMRSNLPFGHRSPCLDTHQLRFRVAQC